MTQNREPAWIRLRPGHWLLVPEPDAPRDESGLRTAALAEVVKRQSHEIPANRAFPQPRYRAAINHPRTRETWALVMNVAQGRRWAETQLSRLPA